MLFYRKIHYLTRKFHVKLRAKTDIDSCDISFQVQYNVEFTSQVMDFPWIAYKMNKNQKKENSNNIVCFYPERALQKAISLKSTVRTVSALANRKQGQSYTFEPSTAFLVSYACFYICLKTVLHVNKPHTNRKDK